MAYLTHDAPCQIYTSSLKALETATLATRRLDLILCAINRVLQNMLLQEFSMDQGILWHFIQRWYLLISIVAEWQHQ